MVREAKEPSSQKASCAPQPRCIAPRTSLTPSCIFPHYHGYRCSSKASLEDTSCAPPQTFSNQPSNAHARLYPAAGSGSTAVQWIRTRSTRLHFASGPCLQAQAPTPSTRQLCQSWLRTQHTFHLLSRRCLCFSVTCVNRQCIKSNASNNNNNNSSSSSSSSDTDMRTLLALLPM